MPKKYIKITLYEFITQQDQGTFLYPIIDKRDYFGNTRENLLKYLPANGLSQIVNVRPDNKSAKVINQSVVWVVTDDPQIIENLTVR